jgi:hypothetical protein
MNTDSIGPPPAFYAQGICIASMSNDLKRRNDVRLGVTCLLLIFYQFVKADAIDPLIDTEVRSTLKQEQAGVFYAWSPHMPLSVDGLAEIFAAGESLDLAVVPVLSSHANVDYARDRIEGKDYPQEVLRQSNAGELIKRDLFLHAPAILIFDDGKFVSPVLPGFRYAADYEQLITRFLESADE